MKTHSTPSNGARTSKTNTPSEITNSINNTLTLLLKTPANLQNQVLQNLANQKQEPETFLQNIADHISLQIAENTANKQLTPTLFRLLSKIELVVFSIQSKSTAKSNSVQTIQQALEDHSTVQEKLIFLVNHKTTVVQDALQQNLPIPNDILQIIDLEIQKIKDIEEVKSHYPKNKNTSNQCSRISIRGNINKLVNLFFVLNQEKINGQPFFQASLTELSKLIANTFADKDGHPLSEATIRTILSPNKIDKRPKLSHLS